MASGDGFMEIKLRRNESSQSWGFRLKGGADQGTPIFIEGVAKNGRGMNGGLRAGDLVVTICGRNVHGLTHDQVKGEILRAGNDLDILIKRSAQAAAALASHSQAAAAEPQRVEVVEEHAVRFGGPTYKPITPKTYQILEDELAASGSDSQMDNPPPPGMKPASIFDRKKDDRSGYLQAAGKTIQNAYGQNH